jgi:hypothetical protein
MSVVWRSMKCLKCHPDHPTILIRLWGLDENGCLWFNTFCRQCGSQMTLTHNFDEQRADAREAYHRWCEENGLYSEDLKLWEWEVRQDGEDSA